MYIIKNAFRNIIRSKGRNILIGIIVFIISVSLCIGLSIRQAAVNARTSALSGMSVTAQISVDRSKMMKDMGEQNTSEGQTPQFDKSSFKGFSDSLEVDELKTYSKASTVSDFYYTLSTSLNATGDLDPVTNNATQSEDTTTQSTDNNTSKSNEQNQAPDMANGDFKGNMQNEMSGQRGGVSGNGDFSIIGYSSDSAMTDFVNGVNTITDGEVFKEGTKDYECIISEELATFNALSVGDKIKLENPNNEDETYTLTIKGLYKSNSEENQNGMAQMFSAADKSNEIYMSCNAVKSIVDKSAEKATTTTDSNGAETTTEVFSRTNGTYVFDTVDDYNKFCEEVYKLGLSEDYTVSSTDVNNYEQSLVPLETLSTIAGYFLIVIIIIGTLILVVLNIFSIRERKYEIGVLTAIGMKKAKVAAQFIAEMLIITIMAVIIGSAVGAVSSVPVANALLENQITSQQQTNDNQNQAFGRDFGGMQPGDNNANMKSDKKPDDNGAGFMPQTVEYISQINSAVDVQVLLELLGICVLLAMLASAVSVTAIMRYDPLKILSNRD